MDWDGFKSSKFGRTRRHFMPRDTIRSSTHIIYIQVYKCLIFKSNQVVNIINNKTVPKGNLEVH